MALTYSRFLYGWETFATGASQNNILDFVDNGTTYAATIPEGVYTPAEFAAEVQSQMRSETGNSNQTCTFSFSTQKFTLGGTATFQLLWSSGANATETCAGLLGFDESADDTGATSYTSDSAVGDTHSDMSIWTMAEPNVPGTAPVTAAADGSAASLLERQIRAFQNRTDGMKVETVYIDTAKAVQIGFRALTSAEQTNMEAFLDWIQEGKRFNWQPDKDSTNALRLVMIDPRQITPQFTWQTRSEVDYGVLGFIEQLSRT